MLAVSEPLDEATEAVPRIGTAFAAGIANAGHMCGALAGALMAIGLVLGREEAFEPRVFAYQATDELMARFQERYGTISCREITGIDMTQREGRELYEATVREPTCQPLVAFTARTVYDLLLDAA